MNTKSYVRLADYRELLVMIFNNYYNVHYDYNNQLPIIIIELKKNYFFSSHNYGLNEREDDG